MPHTVLQRLHVRKIGSLRYTLVCCEHRRTRRSNWNSVGTHGGTYYKSSAVEAKNIFLYCNASNLVLKILQHDKIWGRQSPTPNSGGGLVPHPSVIYLLCDILCMRSSSVSVLAHFHF